MIYELLATALLACSLGAGTNINEPKRASVTFPFLGTYTLTCNITANGDYIVLTSPMGNDAEVRRTTNFDEQYYSATTSDGFGTLAVAWTKLTEGAKVDMILTFSANSPENLERLNWSYGYMQEDQSYVIGDNVDVNEFTTDGGPEIYLYFSWTRDQVVTSTFTFPMTYEIAWEGFGVQEYDTNTWLRQGDNFSKTFNAIYEDNTEPKLYAFWLDSYYLARQVRYNGDIINQNYITGLDRLDGTFGKQCSIHFTLQEDVSLKVSATPYDPSWEITLDYNTGYNAGYQAGKTEGQQPVSWIKTTFDGIAGFFNIQVFPFVTLGFLCFAPLIVVAIIAILRIIKHE